MYVYDLNLLYFNSSQSQWLDRVFFKDSGSNVKNYDIVYSIRDGTLLNKDDTFLNPQHLP